MKIMCDRFSRAIVSSLHVCWFAGLFSFFLLGWPSSAPAAEILTDQLDYQPGDTVFILGSGFAPGETVFFQVVLLDDTSLSGPYGEPWAGVADQDGNVITTWVVCPEECFEAFLHLIAVGETSNEFAETFFTDAVFSLRLLNVTSPTGSCFRRQASFEFWFLEPGGTYTVTVSAIMTGPPPACFTNDPAAITISLGTNFGSASFVLDRLPNTNQYRGNVIIPADSCGVSTLAFTCNNGTTRRVMGPFGTNVATFAVARFPNGCASNAFSINCGSSGQPPSIVCPGNIVTTTAGLCGAQVTYPPPTATGTPTPTVTCTPPSGSFFPVGLRTVVCRATNSFGAAQCSFSVRVIDDDPPTITCVDACLPSDDGVCTATSLRLIPPSVSDNCNLSGTNRVTVVNDAPAPLPLGTTIVTWTARDAAGNSASCQQTVTVVSSLAFSFLSPLSPGPNEVQAGRTLPFRIQIRDCVGAFVNDGVTARLKVQGIQITETGEHVVFDEVIEQANGSGISGSAGVDGTLVLQGQHDHFNLDTSNLLDPNTSANPDRFYSATIVITDNATGCLVVTGDVTIETRP